MLTLETGIALARAGRVAGTVLGSESFPHCLARIEPTFRVGRWVTRHLPRTARLIGQDHRGFYIPRDYTMELAHRRRTGLGSGGESPREIVETLKKEGYTHVMLCPPEKPGEIEFDPTLSRLLAPWTRKHAPLYHEDLADPDGVDAALLRSMRWATADRTAKIAGKRDLETMSQRHPTLDRAEAGRPEAAAPGDRQLAGSHGSPGRPRSMEPGSPSASACPLIRSRWPPWSQAWRARRRSARALGWASSLGTVLLHLGFWLDHVDGQVARWRRTASLDGVYLDYLMHHVVNLPLGFALGYGLAIRSGNPLWSVAGFAIAAGWGLLALHNDCRYKAFFQRLKSVSGSYRIDGGSGGRPRHRPWPRRGLGMVTWPAYKLCEPHVVLLWLTWPGGAGDDESLGVDRLLACRRHRHGALLAPLLAAARITRAVARGTVEAEFDRWFMPIDAKVEPHSVGPHAESRNQARRNIIR